MQNHLAGAIIGSLAWSLVRDTHCVVGERGHYLAFNPKLSLPKALPDLA